MKKLAKLNGAKALSKNEQKNVNGGKVFSPGCQSDSDCGFGAQCILGACFA